MQPEDARSMCCRLRLDNRELRKRGGGLFGANPLTGIDRRGDDQPAAHRLSRPERGRVLPARWRASWTWRRTSLEIKRKMLEHFTSAGLYPYCRHYLDGVYKAAQRPYWANHFNTIGLNGMNECC